MAEGFRFIWIPVLLSCVFQASDNRHVSRQSHSIGLTGNPEVDRIISRIPITLPEGVDLMGINVTTTQINTCTGMREQLEQLSAQLRQTTLRNSQLDNEAFGSRREMRQLKLQLATCSATASAITGSYQAQLVNKMRQLLETFDSDTFLILKISASTREVNTLQKKIQHAANVNDTTGMQDLQMEQQVKIADLTAKTQQLKRSHTNSALILQIISLQNQIWDLEKDESRGIETNPQPDKRILALQTQLSRKISELRSKGDANSATLDLIFVNSKITAIQKLINIHIEESRTETAAYQRQLKQKYELLKRKISQLNNEEQNEDLTRDILKLQSEVGQLMQLTTNTKKTTDLRLKELRVMLENEKKQQETLQKYLEEADYAQAQLTMKIVGLMKEVRELDEGQQQQTSTSTATTIQTVLQAKEREFARAQEEINELQKKLTLMAEQCSGLEERYEEVKTEFEQKITELNKAGDSKAALTLTVINLQNDLKTLADLISNTQDPDRISELQSQLKEKHDELKSKTADIESLIPNPKIILTIIKLQNEIWDLQKKATNESTGGRVEELQTKVDDLISKIDDNGDDNTKLMLKIMALQSQVEQLQRQLSDVQMLRASQITQLRNDLTTKKEELQESVNDLNEKNQTNAKLILTITGLHNQLRDLEREKHSDNATSSLTVTQLREQLKAKMAEHSNDQADIKLLQITLQTKEREHAIDQAEVRELQKKLRSCSEQCSSLEERHKEAKTEFEQKIAELSKVGDSKAALVLNVINLHDDLKTLRDLISNTKDPDRISELQRQLEEKEDELQSKTADVESLIPNPKIILTIIELQNEILDLQEKADNETTGDLVRDLQIRMDALISEIDDKGGDNIKLMLKIMTLQRQVEQLQRQLSDAQMLRDTQVTQLTKDLATKKGELQNYVNELNEKNQTNARLILATTDLHNQLRNLEKEKHDKDKASATITKLREQLKEAAEEHSSDQAEIKALQNKLNQTDAECSNFEHELKDLQNDLDAKMKELQSKSESVTSLALQVSTLTLQLEELNRQLKNTQSETKIKELQKVIDEKNNELAKKTEELKERSTQPQRILQIISVQTEIEKLAAVAKNDTDYIKIRVLQDHMNYLVEGIEDENNENTKLMFKVLAQQDEITRLEKQEKSQTQAATEKINDLENELEDIRNQIKDKTMVMDSSDTTIANLTAQILELHKKIKPLEEEISDLKETNDENVQELQKRLDLTKRHLQDSEVRLKDADTKNHDSIMEIATLRTQLKKAQKKASKVSKEKTDELEQQLQTQQRENRRLENTNKALKQEVNQLKTCCSDVSTQCDDLQTQLQQSHEDADRLQKQLHEKDAALKQLQQKLEEKTTGNDTLQHENENLKSQLKECEDKADCLQGKVHERESRLNQLQEELEEQTRDKDKLQEDYSNLLNETNTLEDKVQALQNKLIESNETMIHTSKMKLDPDTANPRIALSSDNSEMTTSLRTQDVPDLPGRFDTSLAVLGKTGFSAGRHYWEVSVTGKLCYHLGMASESSQRKGTILFSPRKGFWTIIRDKRGQYKAIDQRYVIIPVQTEPVTLGILLDYKKGQISFYDAGSRSHMFSFVGQKFKDKIYPFINFCVEDDGGDSPIVLLHPGSVDWI